MMNMVKDQVGVKNVTSRNGKIVAWRNEDPNRAIEITTPDDLSKVGIGTPDWKQPKLDHLVWDTTAQDKCGAHGHTAQTNILGHKVNNCKNHLPEVNQSIHIVSLNVCGLKSKLFTPDFVELCRKHDIICLTEIKCDEVDMKNVTQFFQKMKFTVIYSVSTYKSGWWYYDRSET